MRKRYFGDRLDELPDILAGPILRQVSPSSVTVWLVLAHAAHLKLQVIQTQHGQGEILNGTVMEGQGQTVAVGKALHICAVTATGDRPLHPAQIYAYDITIDGATIQVESLATLSPEHYGAIGLSYFDHGLPTFATPPQDVLDLKIMHGSCRKPHGGAEDLLPLLDQLLADTAQSAPDRIQQLFFTGDQIYGDDVADPLLWVATDVGDMLLGWTETLPLEGHENISEQSYALQPGVRAEVAKKQGGLTSTFGKSDDLANSHFFSLGEYFSVYLLVWSPFLWPSSFPNGADIQGDIASAQQWDADVLTLEVFIATLPQVRRAMANVAVYMVCDDHDVSDDWYLNRKWCQRVLGKPLGYRIVMNALLAYALCQAWGNTPEQFMPGRSGAKLCQSLEQWSRSQGQDAESAAQIAQVLGLPNLKPDHQPEFVADGTVQILQRHSMALQWYYCVRSFNHEVIVLDTRTWRGYPEHKATQPPMLLSPTAFQRQLADLLMGADDGAQNEPELTLIVLPTNLVTLSFVDWVQRFDWERDRVFRHDVGDSWNFHEAAFTHLLMTLSQNRRQVVILSGDIHYSCAVKLQVWPNLRSQMTHPQTRVPESPTTLVQLTCSAIKNAEAATNVIHTKLKSLLPEQKQDWLVWEQTPQIEACTYREGHCHRYRLTPSDPPHWYPTRLFLQPQGTAHLAWQLKIRDRQSFPDFRYCLAWIPRQKAVVTPFHLSPFPPRRSLWLRTLLRPLTRIWRSCWVQEGPEVIGHNNIGLVSFAAHPSTQSIQVHQDCYWLAPWNPGQVMRSRYSIALGDNSA